MRDYTSDIRAYIQRESEILNALDVDSINAAMNLLEDCRKNGRSVYIFGNGGSSSNSSHFQADFNKGVSEGLDKKHSFYCLNDNVATLMAVANDFCFEEVFRYQLKGRLKPTDVILAISGSGNSKNVINAVSYAKELGCTVIGLTGFNGGKLKQLSDISLHVPVDDMQITEDIHLVFDHLMMSVFCKNLKGNQ